MWWEDGDKDKREDEEVTVKPQLVAVSSTSIAEPGPVVPLVVPGVQELKQQFQKQQSMITHLKETLKQNESNLSTKEEQVKEYASKLSQIKSRSRMSQKKGSSKLVKRSSRENVAMETEPPQVTQDKPKQVKGRTSELKKQLEESKLKFEERTGQEIETKRIETIVEQLKTQVEERDVKIQRLQQTIEQPPAKIQASSLPRRKKGDSNKWTQTVEDTSDKLRIKELEAQLIDLQDSLTEKESLIAARTQAVTLLTQDLSLKGKTALDNLEDTREEMKMMQSNFVMVEDSLKNRLTHKTEELEAMNEKYKKLESINFELSIKNAELQEKIVVTKSCDKVDKLTKELEDNNKLTIKLKLEHKNKIKELNKTINKLQKSSDDKAEILRLSTLVEDLEVNKQYLENKITELQEDKAAENKMRSDLKEKEERIKEVNDELNQHIHVISQLESDKIELLTTIQDQNIMLDNLYLKIQNMEGEEEERRKQLTHEHHVTINNVKQECEEELKQMYGLVEKYVEKIQCMEVEFNEKVNVLEQKVAADEEVEQFRVRCEQRSVELENQLQNLLLEKQQLSERLRDLTQVSSTDSLEKIEHSELQTDVELNQAVHLQKIIEDLEKKRSDSEDVVNSLEQKLVEEQKIVKQERDRVAELENKLREHENTIESLQIQTNEYKPELESVEPAPGGGGGSQKLNTNTKNKMKKLNNELAEAKRTIKTQKDLLEDLNNKLTDRDDKIKSYLEKIELLENLDKDEWGRENDWQSEGLQELKMKCLTLETNLNDLNQDSERLRKENIEIVHLLSEEKVKRKKLEELLESVQNKEVEHGIDESIEVLTQDKLEESLRSLEQLNNKLKNDIEESARTSEECVEELKRNLKMLEETNTTLKREVDENVMSRSELENELQTLQDVNKQLEESLMEQASVRQELEQRLVELEDKSVKEELEDKLRTLQDVNKQLEGSLMEQASVKQHLEQQLVELEDMSVKEELEDKLDYLTVVITSKDTELFKLHNLIEDKEQFIENMKRTNKELSDCVENKERELKVKEELIQTMSEALEGFKTKVESANERTVTMEAQLSQLLDKVKLMEEDSLQKEKEIDEIRGALSYKNTDMANLKQRLEDVKCELTYSYQEHLDNMNKCLKDKEDEYDELAGEKLLLEQQYQNLVAERNQLQQDKMKLTQQLEQAGGSEDLNKLQAVNEDLKLKLKKLAANLKKRAANEKELTERVGQLEERVTQNEETMKMLENEKLEVEEKFVRETSEKQQLEQEKIRLEQSLAEDDEKNHYKIQQMETQLQKMFENSERLKLVEQQDKQTISELEHKFYNLIQVYNDLNSTSEMKILELDESNERCRLIREELNSKQNDILQLEQQLHQTLVDKSSLEMKLQESLAVIESLETECEQTRNVLQNLEEKYVSLNEIKLQLESKNELLSEKLIKETEHHDEADEMLQTRVNEVNKLNQQLMGELEESNKINNDLLSSCVEKERQLVSKYEEEVQVLTETVSAIQDSIRYKNITIDELEVRVNKYQVELAGRQKEIDGLKTKVSDVEYDLKLNDDNNMLELEREGKKYQELQDGYQLLLLEKKHLEERLNSREQDWGWSNEFVVEDQQQSQVQGKKKRKSVSFKMEECDLEAELKASNRNLKKAHKEIDSLRMEIIKLSVEKELNSVMDEARDKVESLQSSPETVVTAGNDQQQLPEVTSDQLVVEIVSQPPQQTKFDAKLFFTQSSGEEQHDYDSLVWDDGWGTDGHLEQEYLTSKVEDEELVSTREKLRTTEQEKQQLTQELEALQIKYNKVIKKLKEMKLRSDSLEDKIKKSNSGFEDLDATIVEEFKTQITKLENREKELSKEIDYMKSEKENLLKRMDVLNNANEKFVELKERQDNDVEVWELRTKELKNEISLLRNQLKNSQVEQAESEVVNENKQLKNEIEALEWKVCDLTETIEELKEKQMNNDFESLYNELVVEKNSLRATNVDLQQQITDLGAENDSLQSILQSHKETSANNSVQIFDYFKSSPATELFESVQTSAVTHQDNHLPSDVNEMSQNIERLETQLQTYRSETDELKHLVEEKDQLIVELANKIDVSKSSNEQMHHYLHEIDVLNKHLQEKQQIIDGLVSEKTMYQSEVERLGVIVAEVNERLEHAATQQTTEVNSLQRLLTEKEQQLDESLNQNQLQLQDFNYKLCEFENILKEKDSRITFVEKELENREDIDDAQRLITEQKYNLEKYQNILMEKEDLLSTKDKEIELCQLYIKERDELIQNERNRQEKLSIEYSQSRQSLENVIEQQQKEIESLKIQIVDVNRKLEEVCITKEEIITQYNNQLRELENELENLQINKETDVENMRLQSQQLNMSECVKLNKTIDKLKQELFNKDEELMEMNALLETEYKQLMEVKVLVDDKESDILQLNQIIGQLRADNQDLMFYKKIHSERLQSTDEVGTVEQAVPVPTYQVSLSEHEALELSARLQNDLDTALYMIHQRDVRCDELTFELTQLLQERDTLQLRLSTALRINEDLKSSSRATPTNLLTPQAVLLEEEKRAPTPTEDLTKLANKLSELHSVGYRRDKTIQDESEQRYREQMTLLGRVAETDVQLVRDSQSTSAVLVNWIKGKSTPKVMHI